MDLTELPLTNALVSGTEAIEVSQSQIDLNNFFPQQLENIKGMELSHFKTQELPLARIKKIMKLDEDVKMISAEAPVLFAKAADIFIRELTLRAWVHTEDNKRRTLQRNDIAMAVSKNDQFDFLIDIVPRDEIKPQTKPEPGRTSLGPDQIQYLLQVAQQNPQTAASVSNTNTNSSGLQIVQLPNAQATATATSQPQQQTTQQQQFVQLNAGSTLPVTQLQQTDSKQQVIQLATSSQPQAAAGGIQQTTDLSQLVQQVNSGMQQSSVYQQVVSPSGEVQTIPLQLTPAQLQTIQLQMQGKTPGQPIVIQTGAADGAQEQAADIQAGQQPIFQIQQLSDGSQQLAFVQPDDATADGTAE